MLPLDLLRISLGGGTGRRRREELTERPRTESLSIGGGGVGDAGDSSVEPSGKRGKASFTVICGVGVLRLERLPRTRDVSLRAGESCPSSTSLIEGAAILSSLLLAALSLLVAFNSASRSCRLRSRRFALRSSFSIKRAHQPARASHRCAKTCSMTLSMSTPAHLMRSRESFSTGVLNGGGWLSFRIACCWGACSAKNGCVRISASDGRSKGRFDNSDERRALASGCNVSGRFGSIFKILCLVTISSSSSNGSSPVSRAYSITPRLHTSTFSPAYLSPFSISGAA